MVHFNRPGYCAIPSLPENFSVPAWFSIELGLFAGRLYFDFSEYDALLDCLQGTTNNLPSQQSQQSNDLKVLTTKTLGFLQEWMALRRQGQDITHTPMGYACQGWRLRSDHPFFTARVSTPQNYRIGFTPSSSQDHEEDDYDSGDDCSDGDDGLAYDEDEIEKEDEKYFESGFDEDIEEKIVDDDEVTEREEAQKLN